MIEKEFLKISIDSFKLLKKQGEDSINQIKDDEKLFWLPDGESNSIAILVKHLSGNMRSRWTMIFEEDGEKSNRNRPTEFDQTYQPSRQELYERWEMGWEILFTTLNELNEQDVMREILKRNEPHSVMNAIIRQLTHYAGHIGQITFLAKLIEWNDWRSQSIPREKEVFDYKKL